jgi:hypothetical protein
MTDRQPEQPTSPLPLPGLTLCGRFYADVVRPLLEEAAPGVPHAAALLGEGSEVLGFDDQVSTDHDWGPRVLLFLREEDAETQGAAIEQALDRELPETFAGYSVRFAPGLDTPDEPPAPPRHGVRATTIRRFIREYLEFDIAEVAAPADWLTFPQQKLLALTAGAVYHDEVGLEAVRARFAWYPHDVSLYLMAARWHRIGQEEHLMGRAGTVGDELGAAVIAGRLVRDVMSLAFLMERQYAPYPKWFGTAFRHLAAAPKLQPHLQSALAATEWRERERHLGAALERLAEQQNALGLTDPLSARMEPFFTREYRVIWGGAFAQALLGGVTDPEVRRIAGRPLIGSVDQFSDNTDLLGNACLHAVLRRLYTDD